VCAKDAPNCLDKCAWSFSWKLKMYEMRTTWTWFYRKFLLDNRIGHVAYLSGQHVISNSIDCKGRKNTIPMPLSLRASKRIQMNKALPIASN
jgi:hypothetical protein